MPETAREQILSVVDFLTAGGQRTFRIADVVGELRSEERVSRTQRFRTHVASRMCVNAPDNHATTYADFERVEHGVYRWRR